MRADKRRDLVTKVYAAVADVRDGQLAALRQKVAACLGPWQCLCAVTLMRPFPRVAFYRSFLPLHATGADAVPAGPEGSAGGRH